jgi:O-antigen/teichoic acid export membrane protein
MPKLGKLYTNSIVYALGSIAGKAVGFLMIPVYTRCLSPADYGTIELMYRATDVISLVAAMGLGAAVLRFYFDSYDKKGRNEVVSTALLMVIVTGLLLALPACLLRRQLSVAIFGHSGNAFLVELAIIAMLLDLVVMVPLSYIQAEQRAFFFTATSFVKLLLGLGLNILLIVHLRMGVMGVAWSALLSGLAAVLLILPITIIQTGLHFSAKKAIAMSYYGLPMIPGQFAMFVLSFADRMVLDRYSGVAEVGVYSLGYRFGMLISIFVSEPYLKAWTPYALASADQSDHRKIYSESLVRFSIIAIAATLLLSLMSKDIIGCVASKAFQGAYVVVPLIAMAHMIRALGFQLEIGILISKKTVYRILTTGLAAGIYILLCILLVPGFGAIGAAWATLLSYFSFTFISYAVSQRLFQVTYDFVRVFAIIAVGVAIYLISLSIRTDSRIISLAANTGLILSYPVILMLFGIWNKNEISAIKNQFLGLCTRKKQATGIKN